MSSAIDHRGFVLLTIGPHINRCHRMGRTTRQSRQSQQSRIPGLIRTDKKTDMKMKTRRQRYDNEDPSAGHDSTPPHSKMMSSSSEHEDRREKKTTPIAQAPTTKTLPLNGYIAEYLRRSRPFLSHNASQKQGPETTER